YTAVRSLTHRDTNHPSGCYWMMTGHEYPRASGLSENLSREDHPHIGSALTAVGRRRERAVPTFVTVPDYIAVNGPIPAGPHARFPGGPAPPPPASTPPSSAAATIRWCRTATPTATTSSPGTSAWCRPSAPSACRA